MPAQPVSELQGRPMLYRIVRELAPPPPADAPAVTSATPTHPTHSPRTQPSNARGLAAPPGHPGILNERELAPARLGTELSHVYKRDILISLCGRAGWAGVINCPAKHGPLGDGCSVARNWRESLCGCWMVVGCWARSRPQRCEAAVSRGSGGEYQATSSGEGTTRATRWLWRSALAHDFPGGPEAAPVGPGPEPRLAQSQRNLMIAKTRSVGR